MKKNKNIPLNLKEQINSRIGLICSIVVMILLVFVFHQLDYQIIQKPADQAAKEAEQKKYCCLRRRILPASVESFG